MGRKFIDEAGKTYGRLSVLRLAGLKCKQSTWECLCECGNTKIVSGSGLRRGATTSCGCYQKETMTTHDMYKTPTYRSWLKMKDRCYNTQFKQYHDYGGKGVKVCDRWLESFENFLEDMGERPVGKTLNRIQRAQVYSKETCNWATKSEQNYDKSSGKTNSSGYIGVFWLTDVAKWSAEIGVRGKHLRLGQFNNLEDAVNVRKAAEIKYHGFNKE